MKCKWLEKGSWLSPWLRVAADRVPPSRLGTGTPSCPRPRPRAYLREVGGRLAGIGAHCGADEQRVAHHELPAGKEEQGPGALVHWSVGMHVGDAPIASLLFWDAPLQPTRKRRSVRAPPHSLAAPAWRDHPGTPSTAGAAPASRVHGLQQGRGWVVWPVGAIPRAAALHAGKHAREQLLGGEAPHLQTSANRSRAAGCSGAPARRGQHRWSRSTCTAPERMGRRDGGVLGASGHDAASGHDIGCCKPCCSCASVCPPGQRSSCVGTRRPGRSSLHTRTGPAGLRQAGGRAHQCSSEGRAYEHAMCHACRCVTSPAEQAQHAYSGRQVGAPTHRRLLSQRMGSRSAPCSAPANGKEGGGCVGLLAAGDNATLCVLASDQQPHPLPGWLQLPAPARAP